MVQDVLLVSERAIQVLRYFLGGADTQEIAREKERERERERVRENPKQAKEENLRAVFSGPATTGLFLPMDRQVLASSGAQQRQKNVSQGIAGPDLLIFHNVLRHTMVCLKGNPQKTRGYFPLALLQKKKQNGYPPNACYVLCMSYIRIGYS